MKHVILAGLIGILPGLATPAFATDRSTMGGHAHGAGQQMAQMPMSQGEIKKINTDKGMITIKHGPLHSLGMGPMTMSFQVADAGQLKAYTPGQMIRFTAENIDGKLTVTHIEAAQ